MSENKKTLKIIKIVDETTVIINGGSKQGIEKNDKFTILDKEKGAIKDPDTNEIIGELDIIKDSIYAVEIYPNMTICKSHYVKGTEPREISGIATLARSFSHTGTPGYYEELNVNQKQITGLPKSNEPISIGDIVQKVN